ncbi:MAG: sporulation protein YabP [Limnochordia bacterium]|jgi:sporulation protein YabP|nr:sporulation protein YabP [Bacillota bacterium]HOB08271.1 sporulation protein YabP [Limnochordia bacterium]NLH30558.1 sporulation protein YabP [Bacillota bacterium]HPT92555.1 sporulation protein YabP [Limnochordia bacterium]HPZ30512.1 sporulation protein YabP [Limnochordia bacterium]
MDERKFTAGANRHQVVLVQRERLNVDGVVNVDSFDDREIALDTEDGGLIIRGEDLHISELNLETGSLVVRGYIKAIEYLKDSFGQKGKGFLAKLFR